MTQENNIQKQIMVAASKIQGCRVFRNNTGMGWVGQIINRVGSILTIKDARPLHAGLTKGSSDLIGWTSIEITPEMVGRKIAVFTAFEVKTKSGRATKDQLNFIEQVRSNGGIAGITRNNDDVRGLVGVFKNSNL